MAATLRRYGLWKCRIPRAAVSLGPIEGQQEKPDGKKESAMSYKSDIEIAREAKKRPIQEIGDKIGIASEHLLPYGHDKAKVSQSFINSVQKNKTASLSL